VKGQVFTKILELARGSYTFCNFNPFKSGILPVSLLFESILDVSGKSLVVEP
jgi:hypothetical protein